jgi:hypothetical protein
MAHFPQPHPSVRAARIRVPNSESVSFLLEGRRVPAVLHEISLTGGLVQFSISIREGTFAELKIQAKSGPIIGLVELLRPSKRSSGTMHPFRFVALGEEEHEHLVSAIKEMLALGYGV